MIVPGRELRRSPQVTTAGRLLEPHRRIAHNGVEFTGASSVAVTRYRYRGANIRDPLDPYRYQRLSNGQDTWRAGCVETRTSGSAGGHGKRTRGNPDTARARPNRSDTP
jgi:hypothetical protein